MRRRLLLIQDALKAAGQHLKEARRSAKREEKGHRETEREGEEEATRGPRDRAPGGSGSTTQEQSWSRRRATVE